MKMSKIYEQLRKYEEIYPNDNLDKIVYFLAGCVENISERIEELEKEIESMKKGVTNENLEVGSR